jgi:hypothetical protein
LEVAHPDFVWENCGSAYTKSQKPLQCSKSLFLCHRAEYRYCTKNHQIWSIFEVVAGLDSQELHPCHQRFQLFVFFHCPRIEVANCGLLCSLAQYAAKVIQRVNLKMRTGDMGFMGALNAKSEEICDPAKYADLR